MLHHEHVITETGLNSNSSSFI